MSDAWDDVDQDDPGDDAGEFHTEASVVCPWCGTETMISLDPSGGEGQEYVEDCHVCCRPWRLRVSFDAAGSPDIDVSVDQ